MYIILPPNKFLHSSTLVLLILFNVKPFRTRTCVDALGLFQIVYRCGLHDFRYDLVSEKKKI
jgi:hypothetical protein